MNRAVRGEGGGVKGKEDEGVRGEGSDGGLIKIRWRSDCKSNRIKAQLLARTWKDALGPASFG